jgi:catechol 2,3-dioxygenase-like lactoylglutathione lyase family enzyme
LDAGYTPKLVRIARRLTTLFVESGPEHGPVFDFLVADVEATKVRLLAAGCTLVEENRALPRCYVRDPYGVTFNIGQSAGA